MDEVLVSDLLERGRVSYAKRAWLDAHESLSRADDVDSLEPVSQSATVDLLLSVVRDPGHGS